MWEVGGPRTEAETAAGSQEGETITWRSADGEMKDQAYVMGGSMVSWAGKWSEGEVSAGREGMME